MPCGHAPRRRVPVHPRPDQQGHGRDAGRPDPALRRHPARLDLMMSEPDDGPDAAAVMLFLPLFFVLFIISFPAGVIVYWITTNTWTMAQQYVVKRRLGPTAVHRSAAAAGGRRRRQRPARARARSRGRGRWRHRTRTASGSGGGGLGWARRAAARPAEGRRGRRWSPTRRRASGPPPRPPRKKKKRSGGGGRRWRHRSSSRGERVRELLERIADEAGVDADGRDPRGRRRASPPSSSATISALLIGHHGQTIDAIQHLAYRIAFRGERDAQGRGRRRRRLPRTPRRRAARRRRPGRRGGGQRSPARSRSRR